MTSVLSLRFSASAISVANAAILLSIAAVTECGLGDATQTSAATQVSAATETGSLPAVQTRDFELVDSSRENRVIPVRVYFAERDSRDRAAGKETVDAPSPVVLFSHGLGGARTNNPYLGKFWAEHGYIAVFMQHAGSDIDVIRGVRPRDMMAALKSAASVEAYQARIHDVSFVLDELERWQADESHPLRGRLDLEHVGLAGHSFGAVTTLAVAGRKTPLDWMTVDEPRIDAFLAMSPQPGKGLSPEKAFADLTRPVLCMTGTEDKSPIDPSMTPELRQQVFAALPVGEKYHLVFDGGQHHAFGQAGNGRRRPLKQDPAHHPIIQQISTQFWDAYLKNETEAKSWLQSDAPENLDGFKPADVWSWK